MKIMLVDDKSTSNFIMKRFLLKLNKEWEIHEFTDSQSALSQIPEISPDLIFLDLQMPLMDGWEFLDEMQNRKYPHPVIILSSSTRPGDKEQATQYQNVSSYYVKPMKMDKLRKIFRPDDNGGA